VNKGSHRRGASGKHTDRYSVCADVEVEGYLVLECDALQFGGWGTLVSEELIASIFRVDRGCRFFRIFYITVQVCTVSRHVKL
jgi:hypothetical protein